MRNLHALEQAPGEIRNILIPVFEEQDIETLRQILAQHGFIVPEFPPEDFQAKKEESIFLYAPADNRKYILIGLGREHDYTLIRGILLSLRKKHQKRLVGNTAIFLSSRLAGLPEIVSAIANGWSLAAYEIGIYQTGGPEKNADEPIFLSREARPDLEERISFASELSNIQKGILDLVNAPSNLKSPDQLAHWATGWEAGGKISCTILEKDELQKLGMDALLAVNRGSEVPAKCIVMEYNPHTFDQTIALVGKGVTFDTGGLSIKSRKNMHYMKSDMGGAGAVMGAIALAAQMELPVRVISVIPATDNSVDALSIKPGDVIKSYSGKTIEIIDTDAEGRLILADGIAYAIKHYSPDHIIDVATLTGNVIQALGTQAAGLYSNADNLAGIITSAGKNTGEKVWRLPVWEAYGEDMRSDLADIRNLGDKPYAGSITAAKFLQFFTGDHPSWAHLDIAGMAFGPNPLSKGYSATAFGIHLLYETIRLLSE